MLNLTVVCKAARSLAPSESEAAHSLVFERTGRCLTSESVEGASLALERVDDVESSHGLAAGVLGVGDGVADDVLEEDLEDTTGLLIDESGDTLDTTTASQAADRRLGDALDVVAQHLAVALGGSALSESLSSLSTARHFSFVKVVENQTVEV